MLSVENITKTYPTRGEPLDVLRGVSLALQPGENLAILGPSGSGKSTLLSIIGGLDSPTGGSVTLDGQNPHELDDRALAEFRNRHIGFVFQEHYLLPQCSTLENVLIPTVAAGPTKQEAIDRAKSLLDRVGLSDRLAHRPGELSGGECQRAALARSLINRPTLLLADEPTGNLDRANADRIGNLLLDLQRQEGMMLLLVTHSERLASLMSRRVELEEGILRES
jgi:lipoprotein-releasing system ATP-binding protein